MTFPIRPARESDTAFIVDAWKKSFEGAPAVRGADREHYRIEMTRAIRRLCDRGHIRIATAPDDEDHLLGFAAFTRADDGAELHYVYVKQDFRGLGIARKLVADLNVTSYTFASNSARPRKGWRYTPRFTI
jgi:GNAT superfamily N-acetyltransferase